MQEQFPIGKNQGWDSKPGCICEGSTENTGLLNVQFQIPSQAFNFFQRHLFYAEELTIWNFSSKLVFHQQPRNEPEYLTRPLLPEKKTSVIRTLITKSHSYSYSTSCSFLFQRGLFQDSTFRSHGAPETQLQWHKSRANFIKHWDKDVVPVMVS